MPVNAPYTRLTGAGPRRRDTIPRVTKFATVGPRQVRVIATDATPDRYGDVVEPSGADLEQFRANPVVLFSHDPQQPIARATVTLQGAALVALIDFPEEGVSERSDEVLRLLKAGILGAVSIGFLPQEWQPLKAGGMRFTKWELLELSVVAIPANPAALVTEKSMRNPKGAPTLADLETIARALRRVADYRKRREFPKRLPDPPRDNSPAAVLRRVEAMRFKYGLHNAWHPPRWPG